MTNGYYSEEVFSQGVLGYFDGSELKEVIVYAGVDGNAYSRRYYYDDGQLIFAYYEGNDAHRFYFYEESLMRWRYSYVATDAQNAVNHDWETTTEFYNWESSVLKEANQYK